MKKITFLLSVLFFSLLIFSGCKKKQKAVQSDGQISNYNQAAIEHTEQNIFETENETSSMEAETENQFALNAQTIQGSIEGMTNSFSLSAYEPEDLPVITTEDIPEDEKPVDENEIQENIITDSKGRLKIYTYQNEILIPEVENEYTVLTSVNEKKVERNYYDAESRFVKKEEWSIPDISSAKIIKSQEYKYNPGSYIPYEKVVEQNNTITTISYNENSKPVKTIVRLSVEDEKTEKTRNVLISETHYSYDSENRLVLQTVKEQEYTDSTYKKIKSTMNKRMEYAFNHGQEITPDYKYYENNDLKLLKSYTEIAGNYTEKIFFEEGYVVTTIYENNFKKKDIYTLNGITVRESDYE